jgi:TolA-binding protein
MGQSRHEAAAAYALIDNGIETDPAAAAAAATEATEACSTAEPQPQLLKVPLRYQPPTTRQQLDSIQGRLDDIQGQLLQLQQKVDLLLQLQQQQQQQPQQPLWVAVPVQYGQQQQQYGDMQQGWLQLPPVLPCSTPRDWE